MYIYIYIYRHEYVYIHMSDMIHDMKSMEFAKEVALPMEQLRSWGREELQEDPHLFHDTMMFEYSRPFSEESKGEANLRKPIPIGMPTYA